MIATATARFRGQVNPHLALGYLSMQLMMPRTIHARQKFTMANRIYAFTARSRSFAFDVLSRVYNFTSRTGGIR